MASDPLHAVSANSVPDDTIANLNAKVKSFINENIGILVAISYLQTTLRHKNENENKMGNAFDVMNSS